MHSCSAPFIKLLFEHLINASWHFVGYVGRNVLGSWISKLCFEQNGVWNLERRGCWEALGQKRFLWKTKMKTKRFINPGNREHQGFSGLAKSIC